LEKATDELQEEVNQRNRTIWDLENEILTIRSTIQQGKDDLNQAKMISEKRIAELEDKLQTFKNQFT
jgi:chromosome segregation ATPase